MDRAPAEIAGVPSSILGDSVHGGAALSERTALPGGLVAVHGRHPSPATLLPPRPEHMITNSPHADCQQTGRKHTDVIHD